MQAETTDSSARPAGQQARPEAAQASPAPPSLADVGVALSKIVLDGTTEQTELNFCELARPGAPVLGPGPDTGEAVGPCPAPARPSGATEGPQRSASGVPGGGAAESSAGFARAAAPTPRALEPTQASAWGLPGGPPGAPPEGADGNSAGPTRAAPRFTEKEAMDVAVKAALADVGEGKFSAAELDTARARAAQLVQDMKGDEGFKDLQGLTLAMGLPATRAAFRQMIRAAGLRGKEKRAALAGVDGLSPITETGCMRVDFLNQKTRQADHAFLVLGECQRGHDLGAQLDRIRGIVPADKWPEILKHLSALIYLGRATYRQVAQSNLELIRKIFGLPPEDPCTPYLCLHVDAKNTTLYLDPGWAQRAGVFVRFEGEQEPS